MTKILLKITKDRIILPVVIKALKYRIPFRPLEFIVDTGSPKTYISYGVAKILNIPLGHLSKGTKSIYIGGIKAMPLVMKNVTLYLKNDNEERVEIEIPEISIIEPTSKKQDSLGQAQAISSILGLDFLRQNKFKLFCDLSKDVAYLER